MVVVRVETYVGAPPEACFEAARDITVHEQTCDGSGERAVAGRTSGPISLGETVTFEARHFGIRQRLTSKIVEFDPPRLFVDEMQEGAFKRMRHVHEFHPDGSGTRMVDVLEFESRLGPLGWIVDRLVLKGYMRRFVEKRNRALKGYIESAGKPASD